MAEASTSSAPQQDAADYDSVKCLSVTYKRSWQVVLKILPWPDKDFTRGRKVATENLHRTLRHPEKSTETHHEAKSASDFKKEVKEQVAKLGQGDLFIFYYNGHGALESKPKSLVFSKYEFSFTSFDDAT
jgi:hypothetical protein